MKTLFYNLAFILIIASPTILIETIRSHVAWIEKHYEILIILGWVLALIFAWGWFVPAFHLRPNPEIFRH